MFHCKLYCTKLEFYFPVDIFNNEANESKRLCFYQYKDYLATDTQSCIKEQGTTLCGEDNVRSLAITFGLSISL